MEPAVVDWVVTATCRFSTDLVCESALGRNWKIDEGSSTISASRVLAAAMVITAPALVVIPAVATTR
jgi:hypothetical protein